MKGSFAVVLSVASLLIGISWVGAQDTPKEAKAQGDLVLTKKAEPPSLFPAGYLDHEGLSDALRRVAAGHPETVKIESLAKTKEGRDVWLTTVGRAGKAGPAKPAILIVANLEADHVVGSQVALGLVERLAGAEGTLLDDRTFYIVPRLNPDGAERLLKGSPRTAIRANLAAIDRDRDGKRNEDGPNDLDGDGLALSMRFSGEKATLVPDAKDSRLLRRADTTKGEKPVYAETTEGIDDDGDGSIDEDPPGGVNLNRNWPHGWVEYNPETGAYPTSEPEVAGLIQFAYAHPEIIAVWSFGLNDNLRGNPQVVPADAPILAEIVKSFASATAPKPEPAKEEPAKKEEAPKAEAPKAEAPKEEPVLKAEPSPPVQADPPRTKGQTKNRPGGRGGAPVAATPAAPSAPTPGLEGTTDGALSEWAYQQFGVVGLSSRLWSRPEGPGLSSEGDARWLEWNDKIMNGSVFVPFHPVAHPTLGKVEVGGWKPGVRINPPIEQVGPMVEGLFVFLKDLASKAPSLAIKEAQAEPKGGGIYEIKATIENPGFLPTAMIQGTVTRKALPVLVKLDLGDATIVSGKALNRIDSLAGSGGTREFRWLILAPAGKKAITIEAICPKAGSAKREIALP